MFFKTQESFYPGYDPGKQRSSASGPSPGSGRGSVRKTSISGPSSVRGSVRKTFTPSPAPVRKISISVSAPRRDPKRKTSNFALSVNLKDLKPKAKLVKLCSIEYDIPLKKIDEGSDMSSLATPPNGDLVSLAMDLKSQNLSPNKNQKTYTKGFNFFTRKTYNEILRKENFKKPKTGVMIDTMASIVGGTKYQSEIKAEAA